MTDRFIIMLETDNKALGLWYPKLIVYKGKEFKAPAYLTTLLAWDYVLEMIKKKETVRWWNW